MKNILEGKLAVVTGGGRGIGRSLAIQLARSGSRVAVAARSSEQLDEVVHSIVDAGGQVHAITADLGATAGLEHVVDALSRLGTVDVLINNAATVAPLGPALELSSSSFIGTLNLNVVVPAMLSARLAPAMLRRGWGRIVNISSGVVARPASMIGGNVYVTSKAALEAHTLNLAAELDGTGVTVNAYRPGSVDTAMQEWIRNQDPQGIGEALHNRFIRSYTEGRLISPEKSAAALLARLTGDDSGQIWDVDDQ